MYYINRNDRQHENMHKRSRGVQRMTPGSTAYYNYWIRKYEKAIKHCREQIRKKNE